MTLFGLEIIVGLLIGGLSATKTVTEIKKNLRGSSARKQADSLAIIAQADQIKFDTALSTVQRQDDNRVFLQLSHNEVLREIERARAAGHRANTRVLETYDNNRVATHRAYTSLLGRYDDNRLAAHRSNNELLRALEESRRMSQTEFTQLFRDLIHTWQDDRIMFFNKIRTDQQTITITLVVIAVLMFLLGESRGHLQHFMKFPYTGAAVSSGVYSSTSSSFDNARIADFFNAMLGGAGLVLMIGPGWTFSSYVMRSIGTVFSYFYTKTSHKKLDGHTGRVNCLAFSPDGTKIASGSEDRSVRLWDTTTGEQLQEHREHIDPIISVAFSPDGTKSLSCSTYRSVISWDVTTGTLLHELQSRPEVCLSAAFSPDGTHIATNYDKYDWIEIRDATTASASRDCYTGQTAPATSVVFSPNGTSIASGTKDGSVRAWSVSSKQRNAQLQGHTGEVCSVVYSPDSTKLASGSDDCSVRIWYVATQRLLEELKGHIGPVRSVAFSPDGTKIVSGSEDGLLMIWDVATRRHLRTLEGHSGGVHSVVFSPDSSKIASGSEDHSIRIWDVVG